MPTDLERAVVRTLIWFSLTEHPVTAFEVHKWLLQPEGKYELGQVQRVLLQSEYLDKKIQRSQGMYALKGSVSIEEQIRQRQKRFQDAERKFKTLRRWAHVFRLLPGVRAVAAGNTLAWWGTNEQSDIDLFLVTDPGCIWSSRFWSVLPFALSGRRPHTGRRDPFCLSFFATRDALQLESVCLDRDVYMAYWLKSLVPVMDQESFLSQLHLENRWVEALLPNAFARADHHRHTPAALPAPVRQPRLLESVFRSLQRRRLPVRLKELANQDTRVVVTDHMLKFHANDRREQFRDRFEQLTARHL